MLDKDTNPIILNKKFPLMMQKRIRKSIPILAPLSTIIRIKKRFLKFKTLFLIKYSRTKIIERNITNGEDSLNSPVTRNKGPKKWWGT